MTVFHLDKTRATRTHKFSLVRFQNMFYYCITSCTICLGLNIYVQCLVTILLQMVIHGKLGKSLAEGKYHTFDKEH